ncbi:hypothetical protein FQN54_002693 [Arachnomyces sp. PD_36]|nr:hypothetical protein FQN54_002693 [Arachnomyces sp. PD_36]
MTRQPSPMTHRFDFDYATGHLSAVGGHVPSMTWQPSPMMFFDFDYTTGYLSAVRKHFPFMARQLSLTTYGFDFDYTTGHLSAVGGHFPSTTPQPSAARGDLPLMAFGFGLTSVRGSLCTVAFDFRFDYGTRDIPFTARHFVMVVHRRHGVVKGMEVVLK